MENTKKWRSIERLAGIGIVLYYILYGAACTRTFYRQGKIYGGGYPSDLPSHISSGVLGTGYSLMERILGFIMRTIKDYRVMAVFLGIVMVLILYFTYRLMLCLAPDVNRTLLHAAALACNLVTAIYIPWLNPYRYLGVQSGNIYHNSTYLGMKLFAGIALWLYFRYDKKYEKGLRAGEWIAFCVSIILVNLMKPNFFICFAPAMGIFLLSDLIRNRGKTFSRIFLFGLALIPSVAVLIIEYTMLFPGTGDGGLAIDVGYMLFMRTEHPAAAVVQTLAFPFWILVFHLKDLKKDRPFGFSWLMLLIAFLEYFILCESGGRKDHGNLSWGYCYAIFVAFVAATAKFCQDLTDKEHRKPPVYYIVGGILLLLHLFFGAWYFLIIFRGGEFL